MNKTHSTPVIGVTGPCQGGRLFWWCTKLALQLCGAKARRITPGHNYNYSQFQGFVLSGGGDINPELYGESAVAVATQYEVARDLMEQEIIQYALRAHVPIFGICRGMQMLNVAMGGSLYQEAKDVLEDFLPSNSLISKFIGRRTVIIKKNSRLYDILGKYHSYRVNSIHHQAVNRFGEGLRVVAHEENGLVQAIELKASGTHPFLLGVQWHPELMLHAHSARNLFRAFVESTKRHLEPHK